MQVPTLVINFDPKPLETKNAALHREILKQFENIRWVVHFSRLVEGNYREIAKAFVGVIAIKSKVLLILMEEIRSVARYLTSSNSNSESALDSSQSQEVTIDDLPLPFNNMDAVPDSEDFMLSLLDISTMAAIKVPNLFRLLVTAAHLTNGLIKGLKTDSHELLEEFLDYTQNTTVTNIGPYMHGAIRLKENKTYLVDSRIGAIQVGIPPETIKVSMKQGEAIPGIYVLPPLLFAADENQNFGEVEFPIYFNFFIKKAFANPDNKVILIGERDHLDRVKTAFKESSWGPNEDEIFLDEEIDAEKRDHGYVIDLKKESTLIGGEPFPLSSFAEFKHFVGGVVEITKTVTLADGTTEEVTVTVSNMKGLLRFYEKGQLKASLDSTTYQPGSSASKESPSEPIGSNFTPPTFGVTFLGTSHGFDHKGNTTGFILWVNGNGILVDPPLNSTKYLQSQGINPSLVSRVILTHCHSDHDSGLLRKILDGEKIEVFTTKTINESYKRKMNAITGISIEDYYDFYPVRIGTPMKILGASFEFDYSFHTIPTIRFMVQCGSKSISYSSDTHWNPQLFGKLRDKKLISPLRETSLTMFLFDADLIIHESGVPPIHTSIAALNDLPTSIKKKLLVVHCNGIPPTVENTDEDGKKYTVPVVDLRIPESGLEKTIQLDVGEFIEGYSLASRRLKLLSEIFLFRKLPAVIVHDLFTQAEEERVEPETIIIKSGEDSDWFYILEEGKVCVFKDKPFTNEHLVTTLFSGHTFGENALRRLKNAPRSAFVVSKTKCLLLKISSHAWHNSVRRYDRNKEMFLDYDISRIARMRPFVKEVLQKNYLFKNLSIDQINFIASMLDTQTRYHKDQVVIYEGSCEQSLFIVESGTVRLERKDEFGVSREFMQLGVGEIFGELSLITGLPRTASAIANEDSVLLELNREAFETLMNHYPNLRVKFALLVEQRLKDNIKINAELRTPRGTPRLQKVQSVPIYSLSPPLSHLTEL